MSEERRSETDSNERTEPSTETRRIDRRNFFRGAAALTVGGLSATAGFAQPAAPPAPPGGADGVTARLVSRIA